jgi:hypothetical protein
MKGTTDTKEKNDKTIPLTLVNLVSGVVQTIPIPLPRQPALAAWPGAPN